MTEYTHQLSMDRSSPFVRLYVWAWDARPDQIDTCRLFWGYLFLPLNLFVRFFGFPFHLLWTKIVDPWFRERQRRRREAFEALTVEEREALLKRAKPSRTARILSKIASVGDRVSAFVGRPHILRPILVLAALVVLGGLGFGILLLVQAGVILQVFLAFLGAVLAIVLLVAIVWFLLEGPGQEHTEDFGKAMKEGFRGIHQHTCAKVDLRE